MELYLVFKRDTFRDGSTAYNATKTTSNFFVAIDMMKLILQQGSLGYT